MKEECFEPNKNNNIQTNLDYLLLKENQKHSTYDLFQKEILNSNKTKNFLNNNSSYGGENLDLSVSTVHTINNTIGTKNFNYTTSSSSNANSNPNKINNLNSNENLNISGNPISKFSPLPKPDFSSIEQKENCLSYINKGSYKKPKLNVPDSPIKTPHKFPSTPGNAYRLGKKIQRKNACRKLNFFGNDEEIDDLTCTNNTYNISIVTNNNYKSNSDPVVKSKYNDFCNLDYYENSNLNNFSNCNFNFENVKFGCSEFKSEDEFKNPFLTFTADSINNLKTKQEAKINETTKNYKNCKKRVFFCENETSEFQLNDPIDDGEMNRDYDNHKLNSAKKSNNGSKKINSKSNSIFDNTPKKSKIIYLNSNSKKKLLRNKYKKNNENSDEEENDLNYNNNENSEIEISEFDVNFDDKNFDLIEYTQSKLYLNGLKNSAEFHSKQEYFNLKNCQNTKKNFDVFSNNPNYYKNNASNENEIYQNFLNNFTVSKFNLEPELDLLNNQERTLMPTNFEIENQRLNINHNFMEENKFSFGKQEDNKMNEQNHNFYSNNPFNYNAIINEIKEFSRRNSDLSNVLNCLLNFKNRHFQI